VQLNIRFVYVYIDMVCVWIDLSSQFIVKICNWLLFGYIAVHSLYFHLYSIKIRILHINESGISIYTFAFHKDLFLVFSCFMSFAVCEMNTHTHTRSFVTI
jgi:hypothetical protein